MKYLEDGTEVIIHCLGENTPGEYRGIVCGIVDTYPGGCLYIIESIDRISKDYEYTCYVMSSACVKEVEDFSV